MDNGVSARIAKLAGMRKGWRLEQRCATPADEVQALWPPLMGGLGYRSL